MPGCFFEIGILCHFCATGDFGPVGEGFGRIAEHDSR